MVMVCTSAAFSLTGTGPLETSATRGGAGEREAFLPFAMVKVDVWSLSRGVSYPWIDKVASALVRLWPELTWPPTSP